MTSPVSETRRFSEGMALRASRFTRARETFTDKVTDLFPTRVRFSGVAVSYNVSQTLFGGTVPLAAAALVANTGSPLSPALVMVIFAAVALAATFGLRRHQV